MKKNRLLYVLLVVLIIFNGIFLFLFLNAPHKKVKQPEDFIAKELKFNKSQLEQFQKINGKHHKEMKVLSDDIKQLKDNLFSKIANEKIDKAEIDSITNLIGQKEQAKDLSIFYHFREVHAICNDKQKERFNNIIKKGIHKGRPQKDGRPPMRDNENRPPPRP